MLQACTLLPCWYGHCTAVDRGSKLMVVCLLASVWEDMPANVQGSRVPKLQCGRDATANVCFFFRR